MDLPLTEQLLNMNNIEQKQFDIKVYQTLLLGVFEALCKDIRKNNVFVIEREKYRKYQNKVVAAKKLVSRYGGCSLTEDGYARMADLLSAFFSAGDARKQFDLRFKKQLLLKQNCRCAICKRTIDETNSHVDHIVPWDYVGDCLKDNYQMLCSTCNTRKGKSTYFELSMLLLDKEGVQ